MKYLFFDIESSDGSTGICEFGYILTDESFNILEKKVIEMNPEYKFIFYKTKPKMRKPIHYYRTRPSFKAFYPIISKLLNDKDTVIFGFAVDCDIRYIAINTLRYKLNPISCKAFDVQGLYKKIYGSYTSLDNSIKMIDENQYKHLTSHHSEDDAELTMILLKNLLKIHNISLSDAFNNFKDNAISIDKYYKKQINRH